MMTRARPKMFHLDPRMWGPETQITEQIALNVRSWAFNNLHVRGRYTGRIIGNSLTREQFVSLLVITGIGELDAERAYEFVMQNGGVNAP